MTTQPTPMTAMRITDGQTNLYVDVTIWTEETFVGIHDADRGNTVLMTLADFRRAAAAVERKVS
jgi:hypothetical protein